MTMKWWAVLLAALAALILVPLAAQDKSKSKKQGADDAQGDIDKARDSIKAADLSAQLYKLCDSNQFSGRKSATPGERKTAEYIAAEFKKYGLQPAGEGGAYLQGFKAATRFAQGDGTNVMGFLEGSDPDLKKEVVAVGGHIDAFGGTGADDDGSGTVSMMEIAQACGLLKAKPKRTLLFIGWGSEEAWMVGSYHYAKTPAKFKMGSDIKFYLNLDMVGRNDKAEKEVTISGAESASPSLKPLIEKFASKAGLKVLTEQPMKSPPGDVMPFYENGVPFLYFYTYGYGQVHPDYHKPTDSPDKIDYKSMEKIARLTFDLLLEIANMESMPSKVEGYKFPHPATSR
jgi:hypothetical protein